MGLPGSAFESSSSSSLAYSDSQLSMPEEEMVRRILKKLPVGVVFRPSDQLLVGYYLTLKIRGMNSELKMKILGNDSQSDIIPEIDVCKWEPWEIPDQMNHPVFSLFQTDHPEWFFFSPLHKKHPNGRNLKRETKVGKRQPSGRDRQIKCWDTQEVIGNMKILVHERRGPSAKSTGWIIHEYSLPNNKTYVLCRLKNETGYRFPLETNLNRMLPELPFNQETSPLNMEVDNSSTGILHNVPANIMTSGADQSHYDSSIASDIRNYVLDDMTEEEYAMLDRHLSSELGFDSDGYLYQKLTPQRRSAIDGGNLMHSYTGKQTTCPQTPLKGAYGKGGGSSSDTASAGHEPSSSPVTVQDIRAKFSKLWF